VLSIDPLYTKAAVRRGKALTELGQFSQACDKIEAICVNFSLSDNGAPLALRQEAARCFDIRATYERGIQELLSRQFVLSKSTFGLLLKSTNAICVVLASARAELGMGLTDRALRLTLQVNRTGLNAEALEISGRATALNGDFDRAMTLFKEAARLDPDLESNKKAIRQCRTVRQVLKDARKANFNREVGWCAMRERDVSEHLLCSTDNTLSSPLSPDPLCSPSSLLPWSCTRLPRTRTRPYRRGHP